MTPLSMNAQFLLTALFASACLISTRVYIVRELAPSPSWLRALNAAGLMLLADVLATIGLPELGYFAGIAAIPLHAGALALAYFRWLGEAYTAQRAFWVGSACALVHAPILLTGVLLGEAFFDHPTIVGGGIALILLAIGGAFALGEFRRRRLVARLESVQ